MREDLATAASRLEDLGRLLTPGPRGLVEEDRGIQREKQVGSSPKPQPNSNHTTGPNTNLVLALAPNLTLTGTGGFGGTDSQLMLDHASFEAAFHAMRRVHIVSFAPNLEIRQMKMPITTCLTPYVGSCQT